MSRFHWRVSVPVLGVCVGLGVLATLGAMSAPAAVGKAAKPTTKTATKVTVVSVTAGKPTELGFKLSKTSKLPNGTVTFKVTNAGVAFHDFKICTIPIPVPAGAMNSCTGKGTKVLHHGQSATLTVKFTAPGLYEFLCTVTGHAAAGMKGILGVGVAVTTAQEKQAANASAGESTGSGGGSTTTSSGGGHSSGSGDTSGCPPGVTIKSSGNTDADGDELGTEPDDNDGCV